MTLAELIHLACASGDGHVAYGWATVDLDRTMNELSGTLPAVWQAVEDGLLGGRGRLLQCAGGAVVVLEPSAEGRLAGWLARHGEGWAVIYRTARPGAELIGSRRMTALGRMGVLERNSPDQLQVLLDNPFMPDA